MVKFTLKFMREYLTTPPWSARSWNSSSAHSILELNFNYQVGFGNISPPGSEFKLS